MIAIINNNNNGYSTEMRSVKICNDTLNNMDKQRTIVDLSAAFDPLHHSICLQFLQFSKNVLVSLIQQRSGSTGSSIWKVVQYKFRLMIHIHINDHFHIQCPRDLVKALHSITYICKHIGRTYLNILCEINGLRR